MAVCYKRLSFSNEEEYKLIEFIKEHPALWDASHAEYGNSELRKLYWMSLAEELNKSVVECRRKWRFTRDYYIHKRRRQSDSTPQRDGKYYSLQFLNKIKVAVKKCPTVEVGQTNKKTSFKLRETTKHSKPDQDFEDSDGIDYNFPDDPTFEKITVERMIKTPKQMTPDEDDSLGHSHQTQENNDDDKSEDFMCNEDYVDESSMGHDFPVIQKLESNEEEHLFESNDEPDVEHSEHNKQTGVALQEKAIDLFFESMAAAVKTFPPQYVAEVKLKVFTAVNEIEAKVYSNMHKS